MDIRLLNNDISIENNDLVLIQGAEETSQNLSVNLRTFLGEWFLNTSIGVPWFQEILIKGNSTQQIESIILNQILSTNGVRNVSEFSIELDNSTRELTVNATVQSEDGDIILNDLIVP
jgi:hypothetical protein